jgi:hypothetical protein
VDDIKRKFIAQVVYVLTVNKEMRWIGVWRVGAPFEIVKCSETGSLSSTDAGHDRRQLKCRMKHLRHRPMYDDRMTGYVLLLLSNTQ